ncbi:MAG TPA: hypothetical protein VNO50_10955 [Pyrinomonadaceae bacterium]|nr:hypothetical protein [Pyrinomonadaceae bacterium]
MSLDDKVESAIIAHLLGEPGVAALGRTFLKGQTSDDHVLDSVIVHSEAGQSEPGGLPGNWWKTATIQVRTRAGRPDPSDPDEDRGAVHAAAVQQIEIAISYANLADILSAEAEDFYVLGAFDRRCDNRQVVGRTFRTIFGLRLYCCGNDLTA